MKKLLVIASAVLLILPPAVNGQDGLTRKQQRSLLKEARKQEIAEEQELMAMYIDSIMDASSFVLEADMLLNKYGQSIQVESTINFVMVDKEAGVFQFGDAFRMGYNGLGGATYEGFISNYRIIEDDKRGTYFVNFTLTSSMGSFDISMTVTDTGRGDASVRSNFSGQLRYTGRIYGLDETRVFKGTRF